MMRRACLDGSPGVAGDLPGFLADVRSCDVCSPYLAHGPRPVLQAHPAASILVVGQAPGRRVHDCGIPFNDASGERLRAWLGVTADQFYDPRHFAIVPVGLCYPGKGRSGDLPPRPECAPRWHNRILRELQRVRITVLVGGYAYRLHAGDAFESLTEAVASWEKLLPQRIVLPHPSPRNIAWLKRRPWFDQSVVLRLRERIAEIIPP